MSHTLTNLGIVARSYLPERHLIRNRDVEALQEKYFFAKERVGVRAFEVVGLLGVSALEELTRFRNPIDHDFTFGGLGFDFDIRPPVEIAKSTPYDKAVAYSNVLSIHFTGNRPNMRTLPQDLANATRFMQNSGLSDIWPYVFAVTHNSLAKIAARRGMYEHSITRTPPQLVRATGDFALAHAKVTGKLEFDSSCYALSMPMSEFIATGQSKKVVIR